MASVGKASPTIVPKFDSLGSSVASALGGVDMDSIGSSMGVSLSSAITVSMSNVLGGGAIAGVFATLTNKALDAISDSLQGAIERFDILNSFSLVMQSLGFSADDADTSLDKMSDHLSGLPTSLDSMASSVQGIAAITGDLDKSTDAALAFNDMMLASGSSTNQCESATEQFRQVLAKGKPDMQDWNSLLSVAPGQMNQLAESMLGPTANAQDLYYALGGGGEEATISMDELLDAIILLDQEGGENFDSFEDQARNATGGVQSSMENMETAIERGLTEVLDAVGSENISDACSAIGAGFEDALGVVADAISFCMPFIEGLLDFIGQISPVLAPAIEALLGFEVAKGVFEGFTKLLDTSSGIFGGATKSAGKLSDALLDMATHCEEGSTAQEGLLTASEKLGNGLSGGLLMAGITVAVAAIGGIIGAVEEAREETEKYNEATQGLIDVTEDVCDTVSASGESYDMLNGYLDRTRQSAQELRDSFEDARDKQIDLANTISERKDDYETSIGVLDGCVDVLDKYMGKADLTATELGEMEFALDTVNEQLGTEYQLTDEANGIIDASTGVIYDNIDAIYDQIEAKKEELRYEMLYDDLADVYEAYIENSNTLKEAQEGLAESEAAAAEAREQYMAMEAEDWFGVAWDEEYGKLREAETAANDAALAYQQTIDEFTPMVDSAEESLDDLYTALGRVSSGADSFSLSLTDMRDGTGNAADVLVGFGTDIDGFADVLAAAGASSDTFADMSIEDFRRIAAECGGDLDELTWKVTTYNNTPLVDKDGTVNLDDAQLTDALGEVYTWNGAALVDKEGNVAVDGTELTDALGLTYQWEGTTLKTLDGKIVIENGIPAAQEDVESWNLYTGLDDKAASVDIDYSSALQAEAVRDRWNKTDWESYAASVGIEIAFGPAGSVTDLGGLILGSTYAQGGVRTHADGFIARAAMPLDVVGEAGAEAIVPLTNERYSLPFAQLIAREVASEGGLGTVNNYYIDGVEVRGQDAEDLFESLTRLLHLSRT